MPRLSSGWTRTTAPPQGWLPLLLMSLASRLFAAVASATLVRRSSAPKQAAPALALAGLLSKDFAGSASAQQSALSATASTSWSLALSQSRSSLLLTRSFATAFKSSSRNSSLWRQLSQSRIRQILLPLQKPRPAKPCNQGCCRRVRLPAQPRPQASWVHPGWLRRSFGCCRGQATRTDRSQEGSLAPQGAVGEVAALH